MPTTHVKRRGAVSFVMGGSSYGTADLAELPSRPRMMVVEESPHLRVLWNGDSLRLLVFIDQADTWDVTRGRVPVWPDRDAVGEPIRMAHLVVRSGTLVEVERYLGDAAKVVFRSHEPFLSGWVAANAIHSTYRRADDSRKDPGSVFVTARSTRLRTAVGGKTLTELSVNSTVYSLSAPELGYRQVVRIVLFGCRDGPDHGIRIGYTHKEVELADLGDGRLAVSTICGPLPVRLAAETADDLLGDRFGCHTSNKVGPSSRKTLMR